MKFAAAMLVLCAGMGFRTARAQAPQAADSAAAPAKVAMPLAFFAIAKLKKASFLYRIPALGGGPSPGMKEVLPVGTSLQISARTDDQKWAYGLSEGHQGWVEMELLESVRPQVPVAIGKRPVASKFVIPASSMPYVSPAHVQPADIELERRLQREGL